MPATIRLGDTGEDVKRLQRVLARMKSLSPDRVTGSFESVTESAVKDFQQSQGLGTNGTLDEPTLSALGVAG